MVALWRIIVEKIKPSRPSVAPMVVLFILVLCFGLFAIWKNGERDFLLQKKIKESKVINCEPAIARGARGETYKTTIFTFRHSSGEIWKFAPMFLEHTGLFCQRAQGQRP